MDPFQLTFLALTGALLALRITWHLRARVLDTGVAEPSEGAATPWIRWFTLPIWTGLIAAWLLDLPLGPLMLPLPPALRWSGALIVLAGLALLAWVHVSLDRNFSPKLRIRADHTLVTHGPYRWVRHPMYTAFFVLMFGFFLLSGHLVLGLTGVGMIAVVVWHRTPREEAMMLERFGDAYRATMARTGALLPRLPGRMRE